MSEENKKESKVQILVSGSIVCIFPPGTTKKDIEEFKLIRSQYLKSN